GDLDAQERGAVHSAERLQDPGFVTDSYHHRHAYLARLGLGCRDDPVRGLGADAGFLEDLAHRSPPPSTDLDMVRSAVPKRRSSSWISGNPMKLVNSLKAGSSERTLIGVPSSRMRARTARIALVAASSVPIGKITILKPSSRSCSYPIAGVLPPSA